MCCTLCFFQCACLCVQQVVESSGRCQSAIDHVSHYPTDLGMLLFWRRYCCSCLSDWSPWMFSFDLKPTHPAGQSFKRPARERRQESCCVRKTERDRTMEKWKNGKWKMENGKWKRKKKRTRGGTGQQWKWRMQVAECGPWHMRARANAASNAPRASNTTHICTPTVISKCEQIANGLRTNAN